MATLSDLTIADIGSINLPRGTTAQRPGSPQLGYIRFNTDISDVEFYNGTNWICIDKKCKATVSGSVDTKIHGGYKIHTFTGNGTFSVICAGEVEYLIVAGGGAGGRHHGGGGGAGGLLQGTQNVTVDNYAIVVGDGGTPTAGTNSTPGGTGGNGGNSSALGLTAIGGGGGGNYTSNGADGGSGGGAQNWSQGRTGGAGTPGQGSDGADSSTSQNDGGGGGGAGGSGYWHRLESFGRDGGPGIASSISGQLKYYAGGGGAGMYPGSYSNTGPVGQGGSGVGGSGGPGQHGGGEPGQPGVANTGGGGGGTAAYDSLAGAGGSGVVIIRYPV